MSEHELFMARRSRESRIWHTRFRRKNLWAEKRRRLVRIAVKEMSKI